MRFAWERGVLAGGRRRQLEATAGLRGLRGKSLSAADNRVRVRRDG